MEPVKVEFEWEKFADMTQNSKSYFNLTKISILNLASKFSKFNFENGDKKVKFGWLAVC